MIDFDFKNPDYLPIFEKRITNLDRIRNSNYLINALKIYYKDNPVDFIQDWMVTYDPRKSPPIKPFLLWPKQREYILWLHARLKNKEDGVVLKCRDMGATWLNTAFGVWLWIFDKGVSIGFLSRKQAYVDVIGDPDSIFGKIRMIINNLPAELLPNEFDILKHAPFMRVINPENGSIIKGEAGDNVGRGGRQTIYFKDESAFYERPKLIEAALSATSNVKIDVSTTNGPGNPFYDKCHAGILPMFRFTWRDDPRRDDNWYAEEKKKLDPVAFAREVDCDDAAAQENSVIPSKYITSAINLKLDKSGKKIAGFDVADEGNDDNCLAIRQGVNLLSCTVWSDGNVSQSTRKVVGIVNENQIELVNYDNIGVGAGVKGESWSLKQEGLKINFNGVCVGSSPRKGSILPGKKNKDMFVNLKAQLWWEMRLRFQRTYDHVNDIKKYPEKDLISIPNDADLISELSQPKYEYNIKGQIQIESKKAMKKRGINSPNRADAFILAFSTNSMPTPSAYAI